MTLNINDLTPRSSEPRNRQRSIPALVRADKDTAVIAESGRAFQSHLVCVDLTVRFEQCGSARPSGLEAECIHAMNLNEFFWNLKRRLRCHREPCKARSGSIDSSGGTRSPSSSSCRWRTKLASGSSGAVAACRQISASGPSSADSSRSAPIQPGSVADSVEPRRLQAIEYHLPQARVTNDAPLSSFRSGRPRGSR